MEKHASHRKKKKKKHVMWIFFRKSSEKNPHLESGQSILVLLCHSDGWRELFMVINKGVWVWGFFKIQLQTKGSKFNFH